MSEQQRLNTATDDLNAARVFQRAVEALGDPIKAERWMGKANRALGGAAPHDLVGTPEGTAAVLAVLIRIENGVVG